MAKKDKQLEIFLSLKDKFTAHLGKIRRRVALWARRTVRAVKKVSSVFFSLKTLLISIASIYVLGRLGKSFIKAAADLETYRMQMVVLYRDVGRALRIFEDLRRFAAASPLETQDVIQGFVRLKAVGVKAVRDVIKELGDLSIVMNRSLYDVVAAYINPQREILVKLGIDIRRTGEQARIQAGSILRVVKNETDEIRQALREVWGERFAGAMEKMAGTLNAKLAVMRSAIWDFQADVGAAAIEHVKKMVDGISNTLNRYRTMVANMAKEPAEAWAIIFEFIQKAAPIAFARVVDAYIDLLKQLAVITLRTAYKIFIPLTSAMVKALFRPIEGNKEALAFFNEEWARKSIQQSNANITKLKNAIQGKIQEIRNLQLYGLSSVGDKVRFANLVRQHMKLTRQLSSELDNLDKQAVRMEGARAKILAFASAHESDALQAGEQVAEAIEAGAREAILSAKITIPQTIDKLASLIAMGRERLHALVSELDTRFGERAPSFKPGTFRHYAEEAYEGLRKYIDQSNENLEILRARQKEKWNSLLEEKQRIFAKYIDQEIKLREDLKRLDTLKLFGFFEGEPAGTFEKIRDAMKAQLDKMQADAERLRQTDLEGWQGFKEGMVAGFKESGLAAQKTFADAKQAAMQLRNEIEGGLANAFQSIVEGSASAKDAFRDMAITILQEINSIIIKLLIVRPLIGALGGWLGGFGGIAGKIGGLLTGKMDRGGVVQGPALVPVGPIREAFVPLPPSEQTALPFQKAERNEVNVVFHVQAMDGKSVSQALIEQRSTIEDVIITAMGRKQGMIRAVRGAAT